VAGGLHFAVALTSNGTLVAWGDDRYGQVSAALRGSDFVAIAAGDTHGVALRADGSLVTWGYWAALDGAPSSGVYTAISAGGNQSLALREDGAVVWWGDAPAAFGLDAVPTGTGYRAISAGYLHALAIDRDGAAVGWGAGTKVGEPPNWGQASPPAGQDYMAVAAGLDFSVALIRPVPPVSAAIADDFNDNRRDPIWSIEGDNLANCRLDEVNQRLELRAVPKTPWCSAFYLANGWTIDPTEDFSLQVDFQHNLNAGDDAWLSILLTPDVANRSREHLEFGVGSGGSFPYFWYEAVGETIQRSKLTNRNETAGTLYISYDASRDELYLSEEGYGPATAWATVPGLLQRAWDGRPLTLGLGGGANGVEVRSGQAHLDNFILAAGEPVMTPWSNVYRFWSPVLGSHFYTISEAERDKLVKEYPDVWVFEGAVFQGATTRLDSDLAPVYRFWAAKTATHFYTIDQAEADRLVKDPAWNFEGVAFYAYPPGRQPKDTEPVYRLFRRAGNAYFYTISEAEKDRVIKQNPGVFTFEGVVFYTRP